MALKPKLIFLLKVGRYLKWLIKSAPVQKFLAAQISALPPGPTAEQRARSTSYVWGEVRDDAGHDGDWPLHNARWLYPDRAHGPGDRRKSVGRPRADRVSDARQSLRLRS